MTKWMLAGMATVAIIGLLGCADEAEMSGEDEGISRQEKAQLISMTKEFVADHMFDPESARFRKMGVYEIRVHGIIVCGEVNAKNRLGGYVGYRKFIFNGPERRAVTFDPSESDYEGWCH